MRRLRRIVFGGRWGGVGEANWHWRAGCSSCVGKHDEAFRKLMKHRGVAEALVRERLPPDIARRITGQPTLLSESFVEASMKNSFADAVLRVPLEGEDAYVFCVVEHKRTEEKFVLVQVLRYVTAIYAWLATHETESLPLVIPLIVYNGTAPWRGPRRFRELLRVKSNASLATVDFEVTVFDLSAEPVDTLSDHTGLKGGLLSLKVAATPADELEPVILSWLKTLEGDASAAQFYLRYLMQVLPGDALEVLVRVVTKYREQKEPRMQTIHQYLVSLARRRGDRLAQKLVKTKSAEITQRVARKMAKPMAKKMAAGMAADMAAGMAADMAAGMAADMARPIADRIARTRTRRAASHARVTAREETLRENLRLLIKSRFKTRPANLDTLLAEADAPTLQKWFNAALTARSARAVFATQ